MTSPPPHPWFPACNSPGGGRVGPCHVITVASSLRLGHLLRLHCSNHLHRLLLFCSPVPEGCHTDKFPRIKDIWCQRSYSFRRYSLLQTLADTLSAPCSCCLSFFSGKKPGKKDIDNSNSQFRISGGNSFNGRLWTNVILALNVLVYVAQIATQGRLILWGAKVNSHINRGQLWRLVTSSFLHANIGHLMINSYSLNSIGPTVEQITGPRRFLAVYFTSAIASSVMSYRFCQSPAVGASGAIFGLVGSFAVFVLRHRSLFGGGKQDIQHIARVIALNMVIGLLSRGIDNWGHLGGLLGGAAMSWFLGPAWRSEVKSEDGRLVFADRAPIFHFINQRRLR